MKMMSRVVLLVLAQWSACSWVQVASSGFADTVHMKIANGTVANITDHPFRVAIISEYRYLGSGHLARHCSGSILSEWWVITAAHCTSKSDGTTGLFEDSRRLVLMAGTTNISQTDDDLAILDSEFGRKHIRRAHFSLIHPNYSMEISRIYKRYHLVHNDIALLKLAEPLTLDGTNVSAISLPRDGEDVQLGQEYTVAAWGRTGLGRLPPVLMETKLRVYSTTFQLNPGFFPDVSYFDLPGKKICSKQPNTGTLPGDSGAGVVGHRVTGHNGSEPVLFGVVSEGEEVVKNGIRFYISFETRVSFFLDWLHSMMDQWATNMPPGIQTYP